MKKKLNYVHALVGSFFVVFLINMMFNAQFGPFLNYFSGDINTQLAFSALDFAKIFGTIIGETGVLSCGFYFVSKKFFKGEYMGD